MILASAILSAAALMSAAFPGLRAAELRLVARALWVRYSSLDADRFGLWDGRLAKVSLMVGVIAAAFAVWMLASLLFGDRARDAVRAVWSLLPRPVWYALAAFGCGLLYFGFDINVMPLVIVWAAWHWRLMDWLGRRYGAAHARDAVTVFVIALMVLWTVVLFWRVSNMTEVLDSPRVVGDYTRDDATHYRAKTHPLYILFVRTLWLALTPPNRADTLQSTLGVRLIIATVAAINMALLSLLVARIVRSRVANYLLCGIMLAAYPTIFQGGQAIESFVFVQTMLLLTFLYVADALRDRSYNPAVLLVLAVGMVGFNLGYAVLFAVLYLFVLLRASRDAWRRGPWRGIGQVMGRGVAFVVLFLIVMQALMTLQLAAYPVEPGHDEGWQIPGSLLECLENTYEEDTHYLNHDFSPSYLFGDYAVRFFSSALYWSHSYKLTPNLVHPWQMLWAVLLVVPLALVRRIARDRRPLFAAVLSIAVLLFAFHSYYGAKEVGLYSPVICAALMPWLAFAVAAVEGDGVGSRRQRGALASVVAKAGMPVVLAVLLASMLAVNMRGASDEYWIGRELCGDVDRCSDRVNVTTPGLERLSQLGGGDAHQAVIRSGVQQRYQD